MSVGSHDGLFPPDSRWQAYLSYETGRPEVFVVPFVSGEAKYQVSIADRWLLRFSRSNELFFATMGNRLMVAQIAKQPNFRIDSIRSLFQLFSKSH